MEKQLESRAIIREYEARKKREQRERTKRKREANLMEADESVKQRIVFETINFFNARTQSMERTVKCEIFNRISQHPAMLGLRDQSSREELQVQAALVANVRNTLAIVKQPTNREELFLKKSTLTMLMNSTEEMPIAKVARVLQVSKPSLYKARSCVQATSHDGNGLFSLAACWKHQRVSTITEELKELVYSFWESESRVSPNKKDVCRKRLGKKSYIKHPVHLLDEPQVYYV